MRHAFVVDSPPAQVLGAADGEGLEAVAVYERWATQAGLSVPDARIQSCQSLRSDVSMGSGSGPGATRQSATGTPDQHRSEQAHRAALNPLAGSPVRDCPGEAPPPAPPPAGAPGSHRGLGTENHPCQPCCLSIQGLVFRGIFQPAYAQRIARNSLAHFPQGIPAILSPLLYDAGHGLEHLGLQQPHCRRCWSCCLRHPRLRIAVVSGPCQGWGIQLQLLHQQRCSSHHGGDS